MFQLTYWSLPSLISTALSLYLLRRVWRQRATPGGWPLSLMLFGIAWWSAGQVLGTLLTTIDGKFVAAQIQYPGIVIVPTAWLLFALRYTGSLPALTRQWPWLLLPPAASLSVALTNELHHWMWTGADPVRHHGFVGWELHYGPFFAAFATYSYAAVGLGTLLMLASLLRSPWHRRRALVIVAAPLLVLATNLVYLLHGSPVRWLDLTPMGFALAAGLFSLALRGNLLDLVPLSREQVVRDLPDAIFVVSQNGRVIDMNPAAHLLVPGGETAGLGRPLWDLLPVSRELVDGVRPEGRPLDLIMARDGRETAWRVNTSSLVDPRGEVAGRVLVFHDQTDRWRAEKELRATSEALAEANHELERLTTLDPLTRVLHRAAFLRQADEELARARRYRRTLSMLVIDLDDLADLNARSGSEITDSVLGGIARLLESVRRDGDLIGRTGPGEFAMLLPETEPAAARQVAEGVRRTIDRSRFRSGDGSDLQVSVRTGVRGLDPATTRAEALLAGALDAAALATGLSSSRA